MSRNWVWSLVGGLCLPVLAGATSAASGLEIVDKSIQFHGGDRYEQSAIELTMCSKSGCYGLQSRIDGGLFDLSAAGPAGGHQRLARITNETVEVWQDDSAVELTEVDERRARSWVMARIYFVFLPYRLNDDSVLEEDLGRERWGGRSLRKVKVSFLPGSSAGADDEFLYWFDPQSGRLEQFAYSFSGNPGGLRFRRAFNYRRVGGILFFDQENWGIDGPGLSVDQIGPESLSDWNLISTVSLTDIRVSGHDVAGKNSD